MKIFRLTVVLTLSIGALCSEGSIRLATPFADGMVLQRGMKVPVWGAAEPGAEVTVSFAGQRLVTTVAQDGAWRVDLANLQASAQGRDLVVTSSQTSEQSNNQTILRDVLVGEVWYCSGQSNAEMPLVGTNPHFSDRLGRQTAQMTHSPTVRFCYASNYKWAREPKAFADYKVEWKPFTAENLLASPSFSAMGVYYALELNRALGVPVGIVGSYYGGTGIDAWLPQKIAESPVGGDHQQPTVLWNEMVAPWCPMAMRGFIWYQGCTNADDPLYCKKMHALYDGWAKAFENPALKLYFVQLAPYSRSWYDVQLQQAKFAAEEKNAAMVTTVDVGCPTDIHPWEKGTVGRRLAALALRHDYGFDKIQADAPTFRSGVRRGNRVFLKFDHADGWYVHNDDWSTDLPFELAGTNGVWHAAQVVNSNYGLTTGKAWSTFGHVDGAELILVADGVDEPVRVRYLHEKPWTSGLYASSGLPPGPFEADLADDSANLGPDITAKLQGEIDAAAAKGGGRVEVHAGDWQVKGLVLKSGVTLYLKAGAVLRASRNIADYDVFAHAAEKPEVVDPCGFPTMEAWVRAKRPQAHSPLLDPTSVWNRAIIYAYRAKNAKIVGERGSAIDGMNSYWADGDEGFRGVHGITAWECENVELSGFELRRTGNYATRFFKCRGVTFADLRIVAGHDGVHVRRCDDVTVKNCTIHCGDDCVAGFDNVNVTVEGCDFNTACSVFRFGGRHVRVKNCRAKGPSIWPHRTSLSEADRLAGRDGDRKTGRHNTLSFFTYFADLTHGPLRTQQGDIVIEDCTVENADRFLHYNLSGNETWQVGSALADITFRNCKATGIGMSLCAYGEKDVPLDLAFADCAFVFREPVSEFVRAAHLKTIEVRNVTVENVRGPLVRTWAGEPTVKVEGLLGVKGEVTKELTKFHTTCL